MEFKVFSVFTLLLFINHTCGFYAKTPRQAGLGLAIKKQAQKLRAASEDLEKLVATLVEENRDLASRIKALEDAKNDESEYTVASKFPSLFCTNYIVNYTILYYTTLHFRSSR